MKKTAIILAFTTLLLGCKEKESKEANVQASNLVKTDSETLYGEDFMNVKTLSPDQVGDIYSNLKPGDTVNVTFKAPVQAVCKEKGCWMQVDVGNTEPVMVRFKDYGFFVPMDIENKEVTVHGRAFIAEVGVEEQRHLAADAGKNQAAIDAITTPQRSMGFTADGVKIVE
ncbi:MAG TPA: DUF4920 domain-containing protein [Leeuwenhoekiella sp.]|nr:DUF4920 domain-containing protein [Leeuwenhoekiella sp.]